MKTTKVLPLECFVLLMYRTWENFGGRKFWRIITDEANGEENLANLLAGLQLFYCII